MRNNKGWICLHRSLGDHFLWDDKPFSRGQAWIDLLLLANHEDKKVLYQGKLMLFKRGTVYRSILSLAERWGWDRKKVRRFLDLLVAEKMITTQSTTQGTTISIVNYRLYQDLGATKRTTAPQQEDNRSPHTTIINHDLNHKKYGSYENVFLSDDDLAHLKSEFPLDWAQRIETLSEGIAVHGYNYRNHLAVIRRWSKTDKLTNRGKEVKNDDQRKEYKFSEELFS